ncbi:MAG: hypothetical protein ACUVUG_10165, partial [Candidatus Aminicenantia bacterium]
MRRDNEKYNDKNSRKRKDNFGIFISFFSKKNKGIIKKAKALDLCTSMGNRKISTKIVKGKIERRNIRNQLYNNFLD